jgi:penicillin-binding protein 2
MTNNKDQNSKLFILKVIIICVGLVILGRLFQMQILDYDQYKPLSQHNALRQKVVNPARGLIYSRNNKLMVANEPVYSVTVTPFKFDTTKTSLLAGLLKIPVHKLKHRLERARQYSWYRPSKIYSDLSFKTFSKIEGNIWRLPGISYTVESKRRYPIDSLNASHIFGYLGAVSRKEYLHSKKHGLGSITGKTGLEKYYNDVLWGKTGMKYILVNALGESLRPYKNGAINESPVKGANLYTSIDVKLQLLAEDLMEGKRGAVVALNPNTGDVLSLVSTPSYNLHKFANGIDAAYWDSLVTDKDNPLFNRAVSSMQPPGSTIKPLMALIGLQTGVITPKTVIYNPGYFYLGRAYHDHADPGNYNVVKAIAYSSNTFFFTVWYRLIKGGYLKRWHQMASDFGLGSRTGIDLPNETKGILPDSSYMNRVLGKGKWGIGDLMSMGIGQGFLSFSPLQMAVVTAEIANNGYRIRPHIVKKIKKADGKVLHVKTLHKKIGWVQQKYINIVKKGMRQEVLVGTGRYYAKFDSLAIAGKTGTAQNPHGRDHGWFVAFAPYKNPQIAIAVLVQNAGFGSISAEPIAALLIHKYLTGKIARHWVYERVKNFKPRPE